MKPQNTIYIFLLAFLLISCGEGGTETGTTDPGDVDLSGVAGKIASAASALVPQINESDINASVSPGLKTLANGTSDEWDTYLNSANSWVITDVFGDPDEGEAVVTKVRVLINQFESTISGIFSEDSDLSCAGGASLSEGDTIEIPFYGEISNGTSDNRYFDCQRDDGYEEANYLTIYGADSDGVIRVVNMLVNSSYVNTADVEIRGEDTLQRQVIYTTYSEESEGEDTVAYLDLQYNQSSLYEGADGAFNTDDDVVFRSRSRITGRTVLNDEGEPTMGTGDFIVTKHDVSDYDIITKTIGRGSYGESEYSLFKIDSDASSLAGLGRTFCVQVPDNGTSIPVYADPANCVDLETTYAWETAAFPFTLTPSVDETFDDKSFFEGNDTDLVASDGSNFTMPAYE